MADGSKLDEALARFEAALRRLETAIVQAHENGAGLPPDAAALIDDREQLSREISDVRAKAMELAERNRNAASRIDSAVAKIKLVLG